MPTPSTTVSSSTTLLPGSAPIGVILEADPTAWDAANTPLTLVDNTSMWLLSEELPAPEEDPLWTSSRDMDGDALVHTRHRNRRCTWTIRVHGSSPDDLRQKVVKIEKKVDKLRREGGSIQRTVPSNHAYFLEIVAGTTECGWDKRFVSTSKLDVTLSLVARPYWHGGWTNVGTVTETSLPCAILTTTQIPGSVAALGRLVVEDLSGADQSWAMWGLQSQTYDTAASARLFLEAEDLTPVGGASVTTGSGSGGEYVYRLGGPLKSAWQALLSTGPLTHTGDYRVWARVGGGSSAGAVDVALEWGTGDFRVFNRNDTQTLGFIPILEWQLVDLGLIHVSDDEGWEGKIVARARGDNNAYLTIDCLMVVPVSEGYGEASGLLRSPTATQWQVQDGFDQSAGNLVGKTLPVGGTWSGGSGFSVTGSGKVQRTATSDAVGTPVITTASGVTLAGVVATTSLAAGLGSSVASAYSGITARWVDTDNYAAAFLLLQTGLVSLQAVVRVAGAPRLSLVSNALAAFPAMQPWTSPGITGNITLTVGADGQIKASASVGDIASSRGLGTLTVSGWSSYLADGGALESGRVGLYDYSPGAGTRYAEWTDLYAYSAPSDPAIFGGQALEVRHDRVAREGASSSALTRVSRYAGDYLLVPCSAGEGRASRVLVKASRGAPSLGALDASIDDIRATLYCRPRFIHLPE